MSIRSEKKIQTITVFLLICLSNAYVSAAVPDENIPVEDISVENIAVAAKGKKLSAGILNTFGARLVLVNGNAAFDGMTILSGVGIKTGKNSGATIDLRQIGIIELSSESSVKLVFTAGRIDLQLLSGKAKLTAFKGIAGSLTGPDGKILSTDPGLEISSVGGLETTAAAPPAIPAAPAGLFGMGVLGTLTAFGGIVGGAAMVWVAARAANAENRTVSGVQP